MEALNLSVTWIDGRTERYRFSEGPVRCGRASDNQVVFAPEQNPDVSGHHVELSWDENNITLVDLDSQNGTWRNGVRLSSPVTAAEEMIFHVGESGPRLVARIGDVIAATRAIPLQVEAPKSIGPSTLQRALVDERKRGRRGLVVVAIIALIGVVAVWMSTRRDAQQSLSELTLVQQKLADRESDLATLGAARAEDAQQLEREREALSRQLETLEARLRAEAAPVDWPLLAERYRHGIFLCVAIDGDAKKVVTGTAFSIDGAKGVLVTNAHVAHAFQELPTRRLIQGGTGAVFSSVTVIEHPRHRGARSPDLAVIIAVPEGEGAAPIPTLPLADPEHLVDLKVGSQVGTLGFPGELTAQYLGIIQDRRFTGAEPTFKTGWVGRLTNYSGASVPAEQVRLIQHSASLSQGTSGSPLFTGDGQVVGISNAATAAAVGGGSSVLSAAEIGFAIRSDELSDLLP